MLFNRPDLTEGLMDIVRKQSGRRIYIAVDGPREGNQSDEAKCAQVHKMVDQFASTYDGDCSLQIQNRNLGCGPGVKAALDWFFANEELGIILEDDCHPCPDFFCFQDEMLQCHRDNEDIFSVAGSSFLPVGLVSPKSVFLTKFTQIWGWGTWRRSWQKYQFQFSNEELSNMEALIRARFSSDAIAFYWIRELRGLHARTIPHTWDIQLQFACWRSDTKNIAPTTNLVCNRGFRADATHTKDEQNRYVKETGNWPFFSGETQLPLYQPDLDILLFWTHLMGMDENRWKYLLWEADPQLAKQLREISSLGDIYEMKRCLEWPTLADVVKLATRFVWNRTPRVLKRGK